MKTPITPYQWVRLEYGQTEIAGDGNNDRISFYHSHSGNLGKQKMPDEVPWCSSLLNAAADACGYKKTDNALASSWIEYGEDTGQYIREGDIVVLKRPDGGFHVTLCAQAFVKGKDLIFFGLGGNQSNMVCVKKYVASNIVATRKWVKK